MITDDGSSSGVISCPSPNVRDEWVSAVSQAIHDATDQHVSATAARFL